MYAAYNNNTEMVRLLLDNGANIEAADTVLQLLIILNMLLVFLLFAWKIPLKTVILIFSRKDGLL